MAGKVKFVLEADEARAVNSFLRVVDAQKKTEQGFKRVTDKSRTASTGLNKMAAGAKSVLGALGLGVGIAGAIALVNANLRKWASHMDEIARKTKEAGQDILAFALMQEPGKKGGRFREAVLMGAKYGMEPGQAVSAFQRIQAQVGDYEKAKPAFASIGALRRMGVPQEGAEKAVSIGMALGLTPRQAARAPYAAGELSSLSPAELAEMSTQGLPIYAGIKGKALFGYSVAAQLSQVYKDPGKLGTYTARAATGLTKATGAVGKLWEKGGFEPGADPMGQLQYLYDMGARSDLDLTRLGFTEKRSRLALSVLLQNFDDFKERSKKFEALMGTEGLLGTRLAQTEEEVPITKYTRLVEESSARQAGLRIAGPESERARKRDLHQRLTAERFLKAGHGWMVGADEKVGYVGEFIGEELGLIENDKPLMTPGRRRARRFSRMIHRNARNANKNIESKVDKIADDLHSGLMDLIGSDAEGENNPNVQGE
jgi:hypothetical protein